MVLTEVTEYAALGITMLFGSGAGFTKRSYLKFYDHLKYKFYEEETNDAKMEFTKRS